MTGEFAVAVHALVLLNHKNSIISSDILAENVCTNPARIRKIMAKLKKADLIGTKEGLDGGYYLNYKASDINLCDISKAVDSDFVSSSWKSGNRNLDCMISSGMADIMDHLYDELNCLCKIRLESISIADIELKLLQTQI